MRLLSNKATGQRKRLQDEENRMAILKLKRKAQEEERRLYASIDDIDIEQKKRWDDFCRFNQEIQQKKAILMLEIGELEKTRDHLEETLTVYTE